MHERKIFVQLCERFRRAHGFPPSDGSSVGPSPTESVRFSRHLVSRAASALSSRARIAAAKSAAFFAPASPIAKVATGMPPGICTIERSESNPLRALDSIGTPSTGSGVSAATMPGRCAAPPAPAMMLLRPRFWAVLAYSKQRSGVRWADTILASYGIPSSASNIVKKVGGGRGKKKRGEKLWAGRPGGLFFFVLPVRFLKRVLAQKVIQK